VIRNGEAIFDEIKEEISTEISGNSESEEEVDVAPPSKLSSIFTETETQGIHEGLVYERRKTLDGDYFFLKKEKTT
jgi:hypothetical protein